MSTYDKIGEFILSNKEMNDNINNIICYGCEGKEKSNCTGCTKELTMIDLIIKNIK